MIFAANLLTHRRLLRAGFHEEHLENMMDSSHGVRRTTTKSVARDPFCSRPPSCEGTGKEGLFLGGRTRARTWDPLIKSQLLYQLSYAPGTSVQESLRKSRSCSKASRRCPARGRQFSQPGAWGETRRKTTKKPPETGGLGGLRGLGRTMARLTAVPALGRRHPCPDPCLCRTLAPSSGAASPRRQNGRRDG